MEVCFVVCFAFPFRFGLFYFSRFVLDYFDVSRFGRAGAGERRKKFCLSVCFAVRGIGQRVNDVMTR